MVGCDCYYGVGCEVGYWLCEYDFDVVVDCDVCDFCCVVVVFVWCDGWF